MFRIGSKVVPFIGIVADVVEFFIAAFVMNVAPVVCAESVAFGLPQMSQRNMGPFGFRIL